VLSSGGEEREASEEEGEERAHGESET
jgi:hypothetical protein